MTIFSEQNDFQPKMNIINISLIARNTVNYVAI